MQLFSFDVNGRHFAIVLDIDLGLERLLLDSQVVSVKPLGKDSCIHKGEDEHLGAFQLKFTVSGQCANYFLHLKDHVITGEVELSEHAKAVMRLGSLEKDKPAGNDRKMSGILLVGIALKLFKSFKALKVALVAASLAFYSVMFTIEFAVALVAVLMFHEYGHVRAMKKFGIPTKGFYLIPFLGGIAVGDKSRTQWESLYISMMGPVYGLVMTVIFYGIFLVTGSHLCGLVASISALLNLFNLFPVHPLDGGQVVKALVFSHRNRFALIALLTLSALCLYGAWVFGFYFLCFFIVIGVLDIIAGWSLPISKDLTPLTPYGICFSLVWYLAVAGALLAIIVMLVAAKVPGAEIATTILKL